MRLTDNNDTAVPQLGFQSRLSELLDFDVPIFGFAHDADVVAAITNAGGVGVLGATRMTPDEIADALVGIRSRVGERPFGVNLVLPTGMPEKDDRSVIEAKVPESHRKFIAEIRDRYNIPPSTGPGARSRFVRSEEMAERQIEVVLSSDVDVFAMGIGSPSDAVSEAKTRGMKVVSLVGAPHHAERALAAGADILVAQGYDAGAHTGQIGTFSLVPQVVDIAGDVPVLAAGGVATGRHIAAALALGAQGVWMGTAWLLTAEHHMDPIILDKLLRAGSMDTVISRADSGKTLRQIRTDWSEAWASKDAPEPLRMPYQDILVGDLLGAIDEYKIEPLMHSPAGQGIAYFDHVTTVEEVVRHLTEGVDDALERLSNIKNGGK